MSQRSVELVTFSGARYLGISTPCTKISHCHIALVRVMFVRQTYNAHEGQKWVEWKFGGVDPGPRDTLKPDVFAVFILVRSMLKIDLEHRVKLLTDVFDSSHTHACE